MKSINILSFIVNYLAICFILFIPLLVYFSIDLMANIENRIPFYTLFGTNFQTKQMTFPLYISTFFYLVASSLIIIAFIFINKIIKQFKKGNIFHLKVIKYLKNIGCLLCMSFFIKLITISVIKYKDDLFVRQTVTGLTNIFEMPISILIFGLFFLILSKIFHIANIQREENIELKQENELTI